MDFRSFLCFHVKRISRRPKIAISENYEDFTRFKEISRDLRKKSLKKSVKIRIITNKSVKKRKENIKKLLQISNLFVIINAVKL